MRYWANKIKTYLMETDPQWHNILRVTKKLDPWLEDMANQVSELEADQ